MLTKLMKNATIERLKVSERMKVYEASFEFTKENAPNFSYFSDIINAISSRDQIKITLINEEDETHTISLKDEAGYQDFIQHMLMKDIMNVKVCIDKNVVDHHFSIYAYDEFTKDVLSLSIEPVMAAFANLLKDSPEYLIFDVYGTQTMFATKTMFFVPAENNKIDIEIDRKQRLEECKENSYFYNLDVYELLPDDFKINIDYESNPLTTLFEKITTLLSITFIATSSTIEERRVKGIINGQRTIEYCCEIDKMPRNPILYNIYHWIYTDGNFIDKAIIARNILSLHCKYVNITDVDEKVIASIKSNYNLYLKENVKEYLELKNKVADFISNTVSKTGEYANSLLDKFKSNMIAIFGFLFTVILANIVSNQPLNNLFTREITILFEVVLLGSLIYLFICRSQFHYEMGKVDESYEQLKNQYKDILSDDDLLEIFNNDKMMNDMTKTVNKTQKIWTLTWVGFLVILLVIIEIISVSPVFLSVVHCLKVLLMKAL